MAELVTAELGASIVVVETVCDGSPFLPESPEINARPELCTIPLPGSVGVPESGPFVLVFTAPVTRAILDSTSCTMVDAVVDNECDDDGFDVGFGLDEVDEVESEPGWAKATPVVPATANPTPSATASAPTRPMNRAYPILTTPPLGVTRLELHNSKTVVCDLAKKLRRPLRLLPTAGFFGFR